MEWYEDEVRGLERAASPDRQNSLAFYGSSTIRLWTIVDEDVLCGRAVNLGFGGSTLAACVWYFDRIVIPYRPSCLILYAGDNDLGDGRSAEDVLWSYRAIDIKIAKRLGAIPFAFISIKPSPARWHLRETIERANRLIRDEVELRPNGCFIDIYPQMLNTLGVPDRRLFADDGLHLSPSGYQVFAKAVSPYCNEILTKLSTCQRSP